MTYQVLDTTVLDALIDEHYAAEIDGDIRRLLATFADDVEHDVVGSPGVSTGKEAVESFYRGLLADLRLEEIRSVRRYHGDGFIVDESAVTARAVGAPFGVAGHGRTVRFRLLHVFEVRDHQIARENAWIDVAAVLTQLAESV